MRECWYLLGFLFMSTLARGQSEGIASLPKKGSYLYYGQPAFEDNSFLLEEAITQEKGVMQFISNFYFDNLRGGDFLYSFTHEIPISSNRHQINYTVYYHVLRSTASAEKSDGIGDLNIGYQFMATGKKDWAMVVPGITLILPTGKGISGNGTRGVGGQLSLAVTKRLSHAIVTHYNAGFTFISKADRYTSTITGGKILSFEKDIQYKNIGASIIWYQSRKFNWLLEGTSSFLSNIKSDGSVARSNQLTINPGFRFAIDHKRVQIVPGISAPIIFVDGRFDRGGLFFYLSFEPEYLPFTKPKTR